jgi:hypothetical protein
VLVNLVDFCISLFTPMSPALRKLTANCFSADAEHATFPPLANQFYRHHFEIWTTAPVSLRARISLSTG